jgi:hypothetical protein
VEKGNAGFRVEDDSESRKKIMRLVPPSLAKIKLSVRNLLRSPIFFLVPPHPPIHNLVDRKINSCKEKRSGHQGLNERNRGEIGREIKTNSYCNNNLTFIKYGK